MIKTGLNLRDALQVAARAGCSIKKLRGTGEIIVEHPRDLRRVRINGRRKDSPRSLTRFLRRLERPTAQGVFYGMVNPHAHEPLRGVYEGLGDAQIGL